MPLKPTKHIWFNDELVPWEEAKIHVLSYGLHYGAAVFEGIRAYSTKNGTKIFRLEDHIKRLFNSAKIYRMNMPYDIEAIMQASRTTITSNNLNDGAYIRPIVFRGYNDLGLHASLDDGIDVAIAAWEWGAYLGTEGQEKGVDVCVSSWKLIIHKPVTPLSPNLSDTENAMTLETSFSMEFWMSPSVYLFVVKLNWFVF